MITEQKLNEIGKEKYISFVELIMGLLERKDFRGSLPVAPTLPRLNLNIIKSSEDLERFVKFTPTKETPSTLKIPGSVIEKIIGEKHIEERGCLIEVRNCLIDDAVLKRFVDPSGDDTDYSKGFFVPNALYAINKGRHKEMRWEEFDMVVSPCMTVSEIKQYIKDVRSIGVSKPAESKPEGKGPKHLVDKNTHGDFFYGGRKIEMSQGTIYYKVFDALYELGAHDGSVSYGEIEKHLVKLGVKAALDDKKRNKRIINAISEKQGLFRFAKIGGKKIPNTTKSGQELVEVIKGYGLKLNNPVV